MASQFISYPRGSHQGRVRLLEMRPADSCNSAMGAKHYVVDAVFEPEDAPGNRLFVTVLGNDRAYGTARAANDAARAWEAEFYQAAANAA